MAQVIVRLSHGEDIPERVDFAAVKPEVERNVGATRASSGCSGR
jgi:hypothetical protein